MDVALLVNPTALDRETRAVTDRVTARLAAHGAQTTLIAGADATESADLLRTAVELGVNAVIVIGGDGTVSIAIQQLADSGIGMAVVPQGTGNDFAATIGLDGMTPDEAVDAVLAGRTLTIDLGRARGPAGTMLFATVLASGLDSRVNDRANRMSGAGRYRRAILAEIVNPRPIWFRLEIEDEEGRRIKRAIDALMVTVANGPRYGGGIPIAPFAHVDDGLLDLTVVRPVGTLRLLGLLPRLHRGTHTTIEEVETMRVRSVRIDAQEVVPYADGEPVGTLPLTVDVAPGALTIYHPEGVEPLPD